MSNTHTKRPATLKRRFSSILAGIVAAFGKKDGDVTKTTPYRQAVQQYAGRHGKHNGRSPGAFGRNGLKAAVERAIIKARAERAS